MLFINITKLTESQKGLRQDTVNLVTLQLWPNMNLQSECLMSLLYVGINMEIKVY